MNTRIQHLNCATLRPHGSFAGKVAPPRMVAHCLLIERADGLVLVDSGFGTADLANPNRLGRPFVAAMRPALDARETALAQVTSLGFTAEDVKHVVLTHLDLDHAGGIGDFPNAKIHVDAVEHLAAEKPHTMVEKRRYIHAQWARHVNWELHGSGGDDWFGFEGVKAIDDDVVLVPLRGHTRGHCGVAVRRPEGGWLLHAGDSYFYNGEVATPPSTKPGLVLFQKMMAVDEASRRSNQERLRELRATHQDVTVFSAHDAAEFERLKG